MRRILKLLEKQTGQLVKEHLFQQKNQLMKRLLKKWSKRNLLKFLSVEGNFYQLFLQDLSILDRI